ncbi:MAG: hypothetical protein IJD48_00950 [Clostridia bacterium]|nr:hypothetical protein [Clostridia bacterium]
MFNFLTYNKLKNRKWKRLSPIKRLKVFQKIEKIVSKKVGRKCYQVVPKEMEENAYGLCSHRERVIYLNSTFFTKDNLQFFALATLYHEQRHAQQFYIIDSKKKFFKLSKAYRWKKNMEGYINPEHKDDYSYYSMQEVERDANKNAINQLKKHRYRFRKEQLFLNTLKYKIDAYANTKDLAKKELGLFYRIKLLLRERKERKKNK